MKKILCLILSFSLVFAFTSLAFAKAEATPECPSIYIPGFLNPDICKDKNDISTECTNPSTDEILEVIKTEIVPALIVYAADGDIDKVAHEIAELVNFMFEDFAYNPDGTPKGNSGAYMPYPEASSITKSSELRFDYDWRGDPFIVAEELNAFIDYVLQHSGAKQVTLKCHSLGSVVATTYLKLYGGEKIMGIVFDSPALGGITYLGELLSGKAEMNGDALVRGFKDLFSENEYEEIISGTLDMLELSGVHSMIGGFLDDLLDEIAPTIYKESLIPLFAYWPSIWAMTPDAQIEDAMAYIFDDLCKGEDYSTLKSKIQKYNTEIRKNKNSILLSYDEYGRMAVIARYGYAALPVSQSWNVLTDTVVDTRHASLWATTAEVGSQFDESYLEGKDMSLISPDRTVDASTCLFPEKTWFIKNLKHDRTDMTKPLYNGLLYGEEEATVDNYDLPRFMIFDAETETISEDISEFREEVKLSPLEKIVNFLKAAIDFLLSLITGTK